MIFLCNKTPENLNLSVTLVILTNRILSRFEEMSGLRINLGKFELVPVGDVLNFPE